MFIGYIFASGCDEIFNPLLELFFYYNKRFNLLYKLHPEVCEYLKNFRNICHITSFNLS